MKRARKRLGGGGRGRTRDGDAGLLAVEIDPNQVAKDALRAVLLLSQNGGERALAVSLELLQDARAGGDERGRRTTPSYAKPSSLSQTSNPNSPVGPSSSASYRIKRPPVPAEMWSGVVSLVDD